MKLSALALATLLAFGCASASAPPATVPASGPTVVLVPGMTGSRLCDANTGAVLWGDSTRLLVPWDGGARLALPLDGSPDDIRPCGAIREMRVAQWRKDIYGGLLDFLESSGASVHVFDYDWRRDNVESARLLVAELEQIAASRGDGRVHLICQSNGGYICRYAARFGDVSLEDAERGLRRPAAGVTIEKLILVGTANGGSMRILREFNRGRQYLRVIGRRFRPAVFFTFPGLYQDLPAYRGDLFVDERGRPMDVDVWDAASWRTYGWSIFAAGTAGGDREAFLRDALHSAKRMHALLRSAHDAPLPRYYSIQSLDFPTPTRAVLERRGARWRTRFLEEDRGDLHATGESQASLSASETAALAMPPVHVPGEHFEMITTDETRRLILRLLRE
jgi:pimeloyl-ACP methyl ester carboxylesterase